MGRVKKKEKKRSKKGNEFIIFDKNIEKGLKTVELYKNWLEGEKRINKENGGDC